MKSLLKIYNLIFLSTACQWLHANANLQSMVGVDHFKEAQYHGTTYDYDERVSDTSTSRHRRVSTDPHMVHAVVANLLHRRSLGHERPTITLPGGRLDPTYGIGG